MLITNSNKHVKAFNFGFGYEINWKFLDCLIIYKKSDATHPKSWENFNAILILMSRVTRDLLSYFLSNNEKEI